MPDDVRELTPKDPISKFVHALWPDDPAVLLRQLGQFLSSDDVTKCVKPRNRSLLRSAVVLRVLANNATMCT